ncbi:hypothetical protein F5J12DRAFT_112746 [Pisolithus orientalis]|uniref:uncharacterized protein n=1 Tax=Pisolithus orientalis TaxID=936130 RepID=UPI002224496A|nr:uncharacterized protein F5J12DRAFT_112746 [Pisolithus orientalis]KAI6006234.1 hypothetical protein F5J12DRAFT_112746 [Pisolithus orientalis]
MHLLGVMGEGIRGALAPGLKHVTTGTLKVDQAFVTCCLDAFTDQPHLYGGSPELKEHYHYLQLIAKHCSDRVAAVRSVDLGSIWSLLCKMVSGTTHHDDVSSFAIFAVSFP